MDLNLGFIGAGGVTGWQHFPNLSGIDRANIVAICDIDEETARRTAADHDAEAYVDQKTFYAEQADDLDAVFVCVPPFAHGPPELGAAERGIDLFVEKPLGLRRETAYEIREAVETAGIVSQVGYMWRYMDLMERAKTLLGDRTISMIDGHWWGGLPGTSWWRHREKSGGQVVEQATHVFDAIRHFGGEVETVSAVGGHRVLTDEIDFADATSTTMRHANGTVSHIGATSLSPQSDTGLRLVGDECYLKISPSSELSGTIDGESVNHRGSSLDETFLTEMDEFLTSVEENDPDRPRSPYADALKTFELTLAVNESIATGAPVTVSE